MQSLRDYDNTKTDDRVFYYYCTIDFLLILIYVAAFTHCYIVVSCSPFCGNKYGEFSRIGGYV